MNIEKIVIADAIIGLFKSDANIYSV